MTACSENGRRLLEDAKTMLEWDRFPTALALAVLAQEEFAKVFLLQLVVDDALPWVPEIQRSMARHQSKHATFPAGRVAVASLPGFHLL